MSTSRLAAAMVVAGALFAPAAAHATVSSSSITSVDALQQPHMSDDRDQLSTAADNQITVHGTTNGTTGDNVKIVCSSRNATINQPLSASVPVAADGSFSYTGSIRNIYAYLNECDLRAVPIGAMPGNLSTYAPKRVQVGEHYSYKHGAGPNAGVVTDYWIESAGDKAGAGYNSIGGCGLCDMSLHDPTTLVTSPELYGSNSALFSGQVTAGHVSRPSAKIDGAPAYVTEAAVQTSQSATGITPLTWTQSVDPDTGDLTIHETNVMTTCATFPVNNGAADCPSFAPTGITIERTIKQNHDGQLVAITDKIKSTDGNAHSYDFYYFEWIGSQGGYQFPGESSFSTHATDDVVAGTPGPASVSQFILDNANAPSFDNPLGAMVTTPAADSYSFGASNHFYDRQTGTVPANGSTIVRHIYALAATPSDLAVLKADAVDIYVAPTVALTAPPASVNATQITLTGTASAMGTLTGVKVNGVDATVDNSGSWTATIPLTSGANAISVVARNSAGLTSEATGSVSYDIPSAPTTPTTPSTPSTPSTPTTTTTITTPATTETTPEHKTTTRETPPVVSVPSTPTHLAVDLSLGVRVADSHVERSTDHVTRIGVACTGTGTCTGTMRVTKVLKLDGVRRRLVLGTAAYSVASGRTTPVALKLTAWGRRILQRNWTRLVHVHVAVTQDGSGARRTVAIKRAK